MLSKLLSARFLIAIMMCVTYCGVLIGLVVCLIKGIMSTETFLGVLTGFTGLFGMVIERYFSKIRKDGEK